MPKRVRIEAAQYLCKIPYAETRKKCELLRDGFLARYRKDYPKAVEILLRDWDRMVAFYHYPTGHWEHIRTTNVVESPFAMARLRTDAAKRFKRVENATAMMWKLLMVAEKNFRRLNSPWLLGEVYRGKKFLDGEMVADNKSERRAA